jgi:hypothetical protein
MRGASEYTCRMQSKRRRSPIPRRCPCNVKRSISLHVYPSDESCGSAVSGESNALPQRVTCRSSTAAQLAERSVPAEWHGKLRRFFRDHARTPIKSNSPNGHCGRYLKQLPSRPTTSASLTSCGSPSDLEALGLKTRFLDVINLRQTRRYSSVAKIDQCTKSFGLIHLRY